MTEYMIREINCTTGEELDRPATAEEIQQIEKDRAEFAVKAIQKAENEIKRQALLDRLGITEEEAKLLLS